MEIRSGGVRIMEFIAMHIAILVLIFSFDYAVIPLAIVYLIMFPRYLYSFRKLYMDKTGVVILYWGYFRKYYCWHNFAVKQLVHPRNRASSWERLKGRDYEQSYRSSVLLSFKPIKNLSSISYYYTMLHPLSCVFIGFDDEFPKRKTKLTNEMDREERDFEVNREEFISKMKEWGVEIKGLIDQQE